MENSNTQTTEMPVVNVAVRGLAAKRLRRFKYMVRRLNKDGSPTRMGITKSDWQFNAFIDVADAEKRCAELTKLNRCSCFVVAKLEVF